jgi:ABC-type dipeptide/oligopeptide/nickel transport system permease component
MVRLLPGDPIMLYMTMQDMEIMSQEQIDTIRHELGLDRNLAVQYGDWLSHAIRGDLGKSIIHRGDVADEIARRVPITIYLAGVYIEHHCRNTMGVISDCHGLTDSILTQFSLPTLFVYN